MNVDIFYRQLNEINKKMLNSKKYYNENKACDMTEYPWNLLMLGGLKFIFNDDI